MFAGRNKIKILTKEEQEGMRKVCRLAREVLDIAAREAKPGVTTDYIDKVVHDACIERNVCCRRISKSTSKALTFSSHTPPL
jgi:methionyl aminopeptidase